MTDLRCAPLLLLVVACGTLIVDPDGALDGAVDATSDAAPDALVDAVVLDANCVVEIYAGSDCSNCEPAETGCPACWLYVTGGAVVAFDGECCVQPCCREAISCP